jgi:hypothetical protein
MMFLVCNNPEVHEKKVQQVTERDVRIERRSEKRKENIEWA